MAFTQHKHTAQDLRKNGHSIHEISTILGISKSTVSFWCRDIVLTPPQLKRLQLKQKESGLRSINLYNEKQRTERIVRTQYNKELGRKDIGDISKRDLFMLGLALYWAEGYKKGNNEFGFTNSDPATINIIVAWLEEFYGVSKEKLILRISINSVHRDRINAITNYWCEYLKVSASQFTKPSFISVTLKKVYPDNEKYFGTLRVKIRNGAALRQRILGSIQEISQRNLSPTPH